VARDDLEAYVKTRSTQDPILPDLMRAAEERRAMARKLAACRERAQLSQAQVAAKMSASPSVVSRIEHGADVQLSTLQKYAAALDLKLDLTLTARRSPAKKKRAAPAWTIGRKRRPAPA
jgi:transcriptional regulator with XRE-family HTH domain